MKKAIVCLAVVALAVCPAISMAGISDIYVSFADFGDGMAESNNTANIDVGMSGSAFIWVDENFSVDTGLFLDVMNSDTNVLSFSGAEVFNPEVLAAGGPFDVRWQSVGDQGQSADFIDELNGFAVTQGTGIVPGNTGPIFEDQLYDAASGAFLFARIDFDVIGEGSASISLATGDGLVVDNNVELTPNYGAGKVNGVGGGGNPPVVPEPSSAALLALGLVGLVSRRRR